MCECGHPEHAHYANGLCSTKGCDWHVFSERPNPQAEHHPWCNYFMRPRERCYMCETMWARYPLAPGETTADLMEKHFPDAGHRTSERTSG
jgi:hypothetical protein